MATPAVQLFQHTFDGDGYPFFTTTWPGFTFTPAGSVNPNGWRPPVVDGHGHGFAARDIGNVTWRGKSTNSPGRADYQADLYARWKNPAGAGRREVGLCVRVKDTSNMLVARIRSMGPANPELRLFKIVGGVETLLASFTGAGLSSSHMIKGMRWRVRVEDLKDGTEQTKVTVYLHPVGAEVKGTKVLEVQKDLGELRGALTVGAELNDLVSLDDVRIDDLTCWDLSDEWNPSGTPPSAGAGWHVELGTTLYSMEDLEALTPKVSLLRVRQGYGPKGNSAQLRVDGDYRLGSKVFPGQRVRVLHDGAIRFAGRIGDGSLQASPAESQSWNAWDYAWEARRIVLQEDDKTATLTFNVADKDAEEWREDRQGFSTGQVLAFLFDRYAVELREAGAAPASGKAYVQAELDLLAAVIPDLALSGTFVQAIETLLQLHANRYLVWWDPADGVWHVRDVTSLTPETLECTAEWVTFKVAPDRDRSHSYVLWMGQRRSDEQEYDTLRLSAGDLRPVWTEEQETKYGKDKRNKKTLHAHILNSGEAVAPNGLLSTYVDIQAGLMDTDDFRGGVITVEATGGAWWVTNNSGSRIWFSSPPLFSPPTPGKVVYVSMVDPESVEALSAAGVGRSFYFGTAVLCPGANVLSGNGANLKLDGYCGTARAFTKGEGGLVEWEEEYAYQVHMPTRGQIDAGFCNPTITLSEPPKPSVGLVNYLPPKGSTPDLCGPGNANAPGRMPQVDIEVRIPKVKPDAPFFREPTTGFHGESYSDDASKWDGGGEASGTDWDNRQPYIVNDPDFTDQAQEAGLRPAAKDILAVKSQKAYLAEFTLASPWSVTTPENLQKASTARFAGMSKRLKVTSVERPEGTGFHATAALMVFGVTWDVEENETKLEAGTAAGWLDFTGDEVRRVYAQARLLKKLQRGVNEALDATRAMLNKHADRIHGVQKGPTYACDVITTNEQTKRVVTIERDDEDKVRAITHGAFRDNLDQVLSVGPEHKMPGNEIPVPGRDGTSAMGLPYPGSTVPGQYVDPLIPFPGPPPGLKGSTRGRYGGAPVSDEEQEGRPPREVQRRGGYLFRKREDAHGNPDGGPGLEVAAIDAHGNPSGGWTVFHSPLDLPGGGVLNLPAGRASMRALKHYSTQHQLLLRSQELAKRLLSVEDKQTLEVAKPGEVVDGYPDGAPADLLDNVAAQGLLPYRLNKASRTDPGGLVWQGPMMEGGANAGLSWRVYPGLGVLARVVGVTPGTGTNGGRWAWDTSGPGGATEVLLHGELITKQAHVTDFERDTRAGTPGAPARRLVADPTHAFGTTGMAWMFNMNLASGLVATLGMPSGVRGIPMFSATVYQDPGVVVAAGQTLQFRIDWAYQASPWTAVTNGTPQNAVTTDATQTGTGQFKQPGGAVPPGLRKVSASVVNTWGGTLGAGTTQPHLQGLEVQVARTESGWLLHFGEAVDAEELGVFVNEVPVIEQPVVDDAWTLTPGVQVAEEVKAQDTLQVELNAPVEVYENVDGSDTFSFSIREVQEAVTIADEVQLELNP